LLSFVLCALVLSGQTLESLAGAYRKKPSSSWRSALLRFAAANPKDSRGALALFTVAVTDIEGKAYEEAVHHLKAAQPRLPQLADYVAYHLGSAQFELKDFSAAVRELESVWKRSPPSPLAGKAVLLAARAYVASGSPEKATRILKEHYLRLPQPQGDLALASSYEAAGNLSSAAGRYQQVYYRSPAAAEAAAAGAALKRLRASLGRSYPAPTPQVLLDRAGKLIEAREYRRARAALRSLIPKLRGTERELARVRLGANAFLSRRTSTAYRYLRSLRLESPDTDAQRLYYLVACARRLGYKATMKRYVERLNRRYPKSPWRLKALIWAANSYLLVNDVDSYEPLYRACYESFPSDPQAAYCHWKVAWSAYLRQRPEAGELLREHPNRFPGTEKASGALYFLGRLAEKQRQPLAARAYYGKILQRYPNHYYARLAEQRLRRGPLSRTKDSRSAPQVLDGVEIPELSVPGSFHPTPGTRLQIERARLLASAGMADWAERQLRFDAEGDSQAHVLAMELAQTASRSGAPDRGIRHIKGVFPEYLSMPVDAAPADFWRLAFPLPFHKELEKYCKQRELDLHLIAGLIRQESEFNPKAISRSRAHGLTQILPSTGRQLSRKLRVGRFRNWMLLRPDFNLRLGTYYFRWLLDLHDGQVEAALASFNAGKSRVDTWMTWTSFEEPAEFVETVPITQTRNYVQAVLRNAAMYRRLYGRGRLR
jgi:soluble lytic murein transglycosylase